MTTIEAEIQARWEATADSLLALWEIEDRLTDRFADHGPAGRKFTLDGHLIGSIGECLAADAYALTLEPASNAGFDATVSEGTHAGQPVEIKMYKPGSVNLKPAPRPAFLIVFSYTRTGGVAVEYDGPADPVWEAANQARDSNWTIRMSKLPAIAASAGPGLTRIGSCIQTFNDRLAGTA